jgi:hypothetical protein
MNVLTLYEWNYQWWLISIPAARDRTSLGDFLAMTAAVVPAWRHAGDALDR